MVYAHPEHNRQSPLRSSRTDARAKRRTQGHGSDALGPPDAEPGVATAARGGGVRSRVAGRPFGVHPNPTSGCGPLERRVAARYARLREIPRVVWASA